MSEIIEIQENEFEAKVLKEPRLVLLDFWSTTCGPCRLMIPVLLGLIKSYDDKIVIAKVNVGENQNLAIQYNIASLPTLLLLKNGEVVARLTGVQKSTTLQNLINNHL